MSFRISSSGAGLLGLVAVFLLWEAACRILAVPEFLVPRPSVFIADVWINRTQYLVNAWASLQSILLGFAAAVVLGVAVGTWTAYWRPFRVTVYPLIVLLQGVPKVAIAPLLILAFGFGLEFKVVLVASLAFFPVVVATTSGLTSLDRDLLTLSRILMTPRFREFLLIGLPHAAPAIFSGMKVAMTLAVIGTIVAEFVSSESGLGFLLISANAQLNSTMAFASLLVLSALGLALYGAVGLTERLLLPWVEDPVLSLPLSV